MRRAARRQLYLAFLKAVPCACCLPPLIPTVLPTIRVPALIMNRIEDGDVKSDEARFIASRIPGAGLMLFPGADHVPWVGQTEEILGEIEEFLTGARQSHPGDRVLATILS